MAFKKMSDSHGDLELAALRSPIELDAASQVPPARAQVAPSSAAFDS